MTNKTIIQTSINKPTQEHINNLMAMAPGWNYVHFDDAEILKFFNDNPIPGFENIEKRFKAIRRGEHRADLFRYYYIYLHGGMFVDFDFKLLRDVNEVVADYDFVVSTIDNTDPAIFNANKRSRAFNGYMYAKKNHPIILQALSHIYYLSLEDLGPLDGSWDMRYHIICEHLYHLVSAFADKDRIKIYTHTDTSEGSFVLDGTQKIGQHAQSIKENVDYIDPLSNPYVSFNKDNYMLFFCQETIRFKRNSGIQRYVRNMSKALLESGVKLVPVILNEKEDRFVIPTTDQLKTLANYDGPSLESWDHTVLELPIEQIITNATHIFMPELPKNMASEELNNLINLSKRNELFVVSVFHDAVAYILKDYYSHAQQKNFFKYMNDVSKSDILISVSESSHNDFNKIITNPKNKKLKAIPILLPSDIDVSKLPPAKENNSKNINILCVSSFEKRKNQLALLKAFMHAKKHAKKEGYNLNLSLVASYTGSDKMHINQIKRLCDVSDTKLILDASEDQLNEQYINADFTVYPSIYEGYGLPIVESLRSNRPVIFSNSSSMKELVPLGGSLVYEPGSVKSLFEAMLKLSIDANERTQLTNQIKNIKHVSWNDYANQLLDSI